MSRSRRAAGSPDIATPLLAWYDGHRRDLPWRYAPGTPADPYRVWLSEIMLQQTTVAAVIPYFERFTTRWPTVRALAACDLEEVLSLWAGLGYYSRARNLHACARMVVAEYDGVFPRDEATLLALPGVGPYTAAAIAAIGHGLVATPVDGNIERVMARLFAVEATLPGAKSILKAHAVAATPGSRAGDHAQALMDLGATICTPRRPSCLTCPLATLCRGRQAGIAETLPRKAAKAPRPDRYGTAFVLVRPDGAILVRRRPATGLLGGMLEVPTTAWTDRPAGVAAAPEGLAVPLLRAPEAVTHVFTHFRLFLDVAAARVPASHAHNGHWLAPEAMAGAALPTLMRRVVQVGLATLASGAKPPRQARAGSSKRPRRR